MPNTAHAAKVRPPEAASFQCGSQRLKLRKTFNCKEIDVVKVLHQFDTNEDDSLSLDELGHLLVDYNQWKKKVSDTELHDIMTIADSDENGTLEQDELIYALRTWYAYVNMPRSVGPELTRISDCPLPSTEILKTVLLSLNDNHPVGTEEAVHVRHVAVDLGATEQQVTTQQMRMAIASWYLHIERQETTNGQLAAHSAKGVRNNFMTNNPFQKLRKRQCDFETAVQIGMILGLWVALPLINIEVAEKHSSWPRHYCQHRSLSLTMKVSSYCTILQFILGAAYFCAFNCTEKPQFRRACGTALGLATLVWFLVQGSVCQPARTANF